MLSEAERIFIEEGVTADIRVDGRSREDVGDFELELDLLPFCVSSARVNLHGTVVTVGVKLETKELLSVREFKVRDLFECSVQYSRSCVLSKTSVRRQSGAVLEQWSNLLSGTLRRVLLSANLKSSRFMKDALSRLRFDAHFHEDADADTGEEPLDEPILHWKLHIDAVVISDNGNVFDALWIGAKSALATVEIPESTLKDTTANDDEEQGEEEEEESEGETEEKDTGAVDAKGKMKIDDSSDLRYATTKKKKSRKKRRKRVKDLRDLKLTIDAHSKDCSPLISSFECLPSVLSMAVLRSAVSGSANVVLDPVKSEEQCCDVLIRCVLHNESGHVCLWKQAPFHQLQRLAQIDTVNSSAVAVGESAHLRGASEKKAQIRATSMLSAMALMAIVDKCPRVQRVVNHTWDRRIQAQVQSHLQATTAPTVSSIGVALDALCLSGGGKQEDAAIVALDGAFAFLDDEESADSDTSDVELIAVD